MSVPWSLWFIASVLSVASAVVSSVGAAPTIELATDRSTYRFAEPVWLYVSLRNDGDDPLTIEDPRCSRTSTRIEIADESGRIIPMSGPSSCATAVNEQVAPGDDRLHAFELLEFYGVDGPDEYPFGILPPGRYEVRYRTGVTRSGPVSFVVDPLDGESTEAFHAYVRSVSTVRAQTLREAPPRFRSYVESYPESSFAPALLCRAAVISDLFFDSTDAFRDFSQLIELYPDSGYVSVAVRHLSFGLGAGVEERHAYLAQIPDAWPGTRAAEFARRELHRLSP